jgi:dUTP pyrophosphatase
MSALNNTNNNNANPSSVYIHPILRLRIDPSNQSLLEIYKNHVAKHNNSVLHDPYANAGFDLFVPTKVEVKSSIASSTMISMNVQCEMVLPNNSPTGFYLYPRSSISKTPLLLANHVGIIDSGYRGNIIGAFRLLGQNDNHSYIVEENTRLLQICAPSLQPFLVDIVEELSDTARGAGGFGSTGV